MICQAKIDVYLDHLGYAETHYVSGTEDEILLKAHELSNDLASRYIEENDVEEEYFQDIVYDDAGHTIEWLNDILYAVVQTECSDMPIYGIYESRADAEEAIFCECETWAYEVLMTDDPMDFFGKEEWDFHEDWKYLMNDAWRAFEIRVVPLFREVI